MTVETYSTLVEGQKFREIAKKHKDVKEYRKAIEALKNGIAVSRESVSLYYELSQLLHCLAERAEDLDLVASLLQQAIENGNGIMDFLMTKMPKRIVLKSQQSRWSRMQDEAEFTHVCVEKLGLVYAQSGRDHELKELLSSNSFTHRLSRTVLNYHQQQQKSSEISTGTDYREYLSCFDNVLQNDVLEKMHSFFSPNSQFWTFHNYDEFESTGYFSYLYNVDQDPSNFVEQVINSIFVLLKRKFPQKASRIKKAEWWAHCRPHCMGHQMHYDSENEGKGTVRHPILSTVLYLSSNNIGGPTFVTNQLLTDQTLANRGWMVFPQQNRLAVFDSNYLHGVVPGQGVTRDASARRITFMIGFWDDIEAIESPGHGASRNLPPVGTDADSWLQDIQIDTSIIGDQLLLHPVEAEPPIPVSSVWQSIDGTELESLSLPLYERCFQGF